MIMRNLKEKQKDNLLISLDRRLEIAGINGNKALLKQLEEEREYYNRKY